MDNFRTKYLTARENSSVRDAVDGYMRQVWTIMPAIISEDSDGHITKLKSALKMSVLQVDGSTKMVEFPEMQTAPVHFRGGGGVSHTHPVKKDDEGIAIFASMAQDLWHEKGGVQDPVDNRRHHLSDVRYIPGGRSDPRKLNPAPSTSSDQSRSDDGKHVWDLHPTSGLTAASEKKHLVTVAGQNGAGTVHLASGNIIKNTKNKFLLNTVEQDPLPPPGISIANRKIIATKPIGAVGEKSGPIGAIMSSVFSGGAGAIFANPIAAQAGSLSTAITSAISSLPVAGGPNVTGLLSALGGGGGLSSALGSLTAGASAFAGATPPGVGGFGLSDLLGHASALTNFFGSAASAPSAVSLNTVLAPLQSGNLLFTISENINTLVGDVLSGHVSVSNATTMVNGWTNTVGSLIPQAHSAITAMNSTAPLLDLVLTAANAGTSQDAAEKSVHTAISNTNLAALTQLMHDLLAPSPADVASIQAFPDLATSQPGARGGM